MVILAALSATLTAAPRTRQLEALTLLAATLQAIGDRQGEIDGDKLPYRARNWPAWTLAQLSDPAVAPA